MVNASGWRLHTPGLCDDIDLARAAVIAWGSAHAQLATWLSPRRCVLVADDEVHGWRLWQLVAPTPTLWSSLSTALLSKDAAVIATAVEDAVAVSGIVDEQWAASPFSLPCTLETVGDDGAFVALMPTLERLQVGGGDRRARLLRQLVRLLRSTLGADAELYLPLLE